MTTAGAVPHQQAAKLVLDAEEALISFQRKTQAYFETMWLETRKVHFGDRDKSTYRALLMRATEAGLFKQPEEV